MKSRRRWLAVLALVILALAVGAVMAADYARSRPDIAAGSTVAGVDVGGLDAAAARAKVAKALSSRFQPVTVRSAGRTFTLTPAEAKLEADVDGMVEEAVAANAGSALARAWRDLTGHPHAATVPLRVHVSKAAVAKWVAAVAQEVERPATDATVRPTPTRLKLVKGRVGLAVKSALLRERLLAALQAPAAREVELPLARVVPKTTTAELAQKYPRYLLVSKATRELRLFVDLKLKKVYHVAVGQPAYPTPEGLFAIQNKAVDPAWSVPNASWAGDLAGQVIPGGSPLNPLKERWLGIHDGSGIHGTADTGSIGTFASHGCVRMLIPDVIELYDQVPVGTPIFIG